MATTNVNYEVPKNKHSIIIGKAGANIRELQSRYNVHISVPSQQDPSALVSIQGTPQNIAAAEQAIEKLIGLDIKASKNTAPPVRTNTAPAIKGKDLTVPRIARSLFFPTDQDNEFDEFLSWLASPKKTLDICVFTITDNRVVDIVLHHAKNGVAVRVITDDEKAVDLGSDAQKMKQAGIPVRTDRSKAHMHHKFAVMDGIVLMNGSFNWTRAASLENRENIVISNDAEIVKHFATEFNHLWDLYKDYQL